MAGSSDLAVEAVRLSPFLQSHYSDTFMDNVCFLKVDTEGHDVLILGDLSDHFRPAVVWTEWFREFQFVNFTARVLEVRGSSERSTDLYSDLTMQDLNYCSVQCTVQFTVHSTVYSVLTLQDLNYCTLQSAELFRTVLRKGYEIFQPRWPLTRSHHSHVFIITKIFFYFQLK